MKTEIALSFIARPIFGRPRRRRGFKYDAPMECLESRVLLSCDPATTPSTGDGTNPATGDESPSPPPTDGSGSDSLSDGATSSGSTPGLTGGSGSSECGGAMVDPSMQYGILNSYTLAHMSDAAYIGSDGKKKPDGTDFTKDDVTAKLPQKLQDAGWEADKIASDEVSGFQAVLFKNATSGEYVLAFAGTNVLSSADWSMDAANAKSLTTTQYQTAMRIAQELKTNLANMGVDPEHKLRLTGHSLGGGLASAASLVTDIRAVTFNAAGIHKNAVDNNGNKLDLTKADGLITAYRVCWYGGVIYADPLSALQGGTRPSALVGVIPAWLLLFTGNTGKTVKISLPLNTLANFNAHGMAAVLKAGGWDN